VATNGPIVLPPDDDMSMEHWWNDDIDRGKPKNSGLKTRPCATSSITNPTWSDPGANPALRGGRPATDRLSHGTASVWC
jgi:hypothetical protein